MNLNIKTQTYESLLNEVDIIEIEKTYSNLSPSVFVGSRFTFLLEKFEIEQTMAEFYFTPSSNL